MKITLFFLWFVFWGLPFGFNINLLAQEMIPATPLMFRNNPQLTGVTDELPIYKLKYIKFQFHAGGPIRSTPAVLKGTIYFGDADGYFYAVDSETGKERWKFMTAGAVNSSPAITNKMAYFTSSDGFLYAVNSGNGKEIWKISLGNDLGNENYWDNYISSPNIVGNILFVGSGSGYLYAFNIVSKKLLWKYNAGSRIRTTPAVFTDNVVFGSNSGYLFNINRITGQLRWKFATDGVQNTFESLDNDRKSIFCAPAVENGVIVTGGRDGIVYGLDLATGKEKWRNDHKGAWILSTAIKNGVVYIGSGSDFLMQALDLNTGSEKWQYKAPAAIFSSTAIAGNMLYFNDIDFNGSLHALDSKTGIEKWRFPMGCRSFSTPVVHHGIIYCGSENGILYAVQGNMEGEPVFAPVNKIVYWEGKKNNKDYSYFKLGIDEYIRNYFQALGYQLMDSKQLEQFMTEQKEKKSRSVIVFADNRFPDNIIQKKYNKPIICQYLEAGGKIALLGVNPLAYVKDTTGKVIGYNDTIPGKLLDINYSIKKNIRGLYVSTITKFGEENGLSGTYIGNSNLTVIIPDHLTKVLATDEYGSATEWIRNYGGPEGSGLLQLWIPQNEISPNFSQLRAVIEHGITW